MGGVSCAHDHRLLHYGRQRLVLGVVVPGGGCGGAAAAATAAATVAAVDVSVGPYYALERKPAGAIPLGRPLGGLHGRVAQLVQALELAAQDLGGDAPAALH